MDGIATRLLQALRPASAVRLDGVTGLPIWRHPARALEAWFAEGRQHGHPLAVLVAHVDSLAALSNRYGRAAGDLVLRDMARLLTTTLPASALIARTNAGAFIALLGDLAGDDAAILGERLRRTIEHQVFRLADGTLVRCTLSVGTAGSGDARTARELLEQAMLASERAAQTGNATARPSAPTGPASPAQSASTTGWLATVLLWTTACLGLTVIAWGLVEVTRQAAWPVLLPFLGLAIIAEGFTAQVFETNRQRISLSFTIAVTMAAVTVLPAGAPLVSLTAALLHVVRRRQRQLDRLLFNLSNPAVAAATASAVAATLQPSDPVMTVWHLVAALAAVASFYLANIGLITVMISFHSGRPLLAVAREASWFGPTNIVLGLTGAFLGVAYDEIGVLGVIMFIAPLLVMRLTLALYARQSQQTIAALEAARSAAEAAVRTREEFLSVASHELRTPLTTIKGYVQLLGRFVRQPPLDGHRLTRYVDHLQAQIGRLEGLVADLLDSARIQQGRLDLHRERVDLAAIAHEVVERFQETPVRTPAHRLVLEAPTAVVGIWDPARLDQVLTNLVSNAFKYSPAGGTVRLMVVAAAGGAELRVSDEGVGIPVAEQGRLFQPFARGNAAPSNIPGAGLGLYITAQIVARHGGRIDLHSQPGLGSTFTVWLPLQPPAGP